MIISEIFPDGSTEKEKTSPRLLNLYDFGQTVVLNMVRRASRRWRKRNWRLATKCKLQSLVECGTQLTRTDVWAYTATQKKN